jgi:hypothetical protein
MATIYEVTEELMTLMDMAEDEDLDERALQDTLEGLEGEFDAKVEGWCKAIKNLEGERDAVKAEAKRLSDRAKQIDNNITRMKGVLKTCLTVLGKKDAGGVIGAHIRKNGGLLPLQYAEGFTPDDAPELLRKVTYSFDTDAIREALDAGKDLPFVKYGERGEYITIK